MRRKGGWEGGDEEGEGWMQWEGRLMEEEGERVEVKGEGGCNGMVGKRRREGEEEMEEEEREEEEGEEKRRRRRKRRRR